MRFSLIPLIVVLLTEGVYLPAQEPAFRWKLSSFGTLGTAYNSTSQADFLRDLSQPNGASHELNSRMDSRLGIQVSANLGDPFTATLQVVSKDHGEGSFAPQVTWAFLGWHPAPEVQIRAGRVGFDIFMNSDSRDVGYSFLWVRPPVDYFGTLPISHLDGLDVNRSFTLGDKASLRVKAFAGGASEHLPVMGGPPLDLSGGQLAGVVLEYQYGDWRARLAGGQLKLRHDIKEPIADLQMGLRQFGAMFQDPRLPQAAEALRLQDKTCHYYSAGLSFERGNLQTQGALARYTSDAAMSPDYWSGFLSCGYRLGKVVPYALWSRLVTDRPHIDLGPLPSLPMPEAQTLTMGVQRALASNQNDQSTFSAGLRWDFTSQASFKFQVDRIRTHDSSGLWANATHDWDGQATVISAVVDFVF